MSRNAKIAYFFIAIVTMACFALASVFMAENRPGWATVLFVLAFVITGAGFVTKARLVHK